VSQDLNPRVAERLVRAARAAHALSETLWEALHEELSAPEARRVAELSARLADVSAAVELLARVGAGEGALPERGFAGPSTAMWTGASHGRAEEQDALALRAVPAQEGSPREESFEPGLQERAVEEAWRTVERPPQAAVLVDEREPTTPLSAPGHAPGEPQIAIRDERDERRREETGGEAHRQAGHAGEGHEQQTPWIAAIARRLERYEHDRAPFAALLIELVDVERLRHAELPGEVARLTGLLETVLARELRPADSLTRESPGRYWLLAPETDSDSVKSLVARLSAAVRAGVSHRGAPLELAVGIAVCPTDGSRAAALAARADIALYAARAAGRPLAP
jgi:GGDEF domain-containing protein